MKLILRAAAKGYAVVAVAAGVFAFVTDSDCFSQKTRFSHASFQGIFWPFWNVIEELEHEAEAKKVFPLDLLYILVPRITHKQALLWLKSPSRLLSGYAPWDALSGDEASREAVYQAAEDFAAQSAAV